MPRYPLKTPLIEILLGRVDASHPDGCWPYLGYNGKPGYSLRAAKAFLWWFRGWYSDELHVLHGCKCKECVNPFHLYYGTPKENARDRKRDGTQVDMRMVANRRWGNI
jgi:hypothetical protein